MAGEIVHFESELLHHGNRAIKKPDLATHVARAADLAADLSRSARCSPKRLTDSLLGDQPSHGGAAYVTVRRGVIDSGSEALAHTLAERQQRGEIPAGRIVSAKPAR